MYEHADELLGAAGYSWYEVSNWARADPASAAHEGMVPSNPRPPDPRFVSRHNLAYWRGADWWGIGPGAHSHVGGVRWWNAKHPAAYAERIRARVSPAVGRETLDPSTRELERILLESRTRAGLQVASLGPEARRAIAGLLADELVDPAAAFAGRLTLTRRGRLLADDVARRLT
jgi:oxygen-independent coproporphyrinogen-3 oxidase